MTALALCAAAITALLEWKRKIATAAPTPWAEKEEALSRQLEQATRYRSSFG